MEVLKGMKSILQSGKYSDLTITCGDNTFKVHRSVICPRSRFFEAACDNEFKEGRTGEVALVDDDPTTVKRMISYLYTLDYENEGNLEVEVAASFPIPGESVEADTLTLVDAQDDEPEEKPAHFSDVRVYAIADKYGIIELKQLAKRRFERWAGQNWSHKDFPVIVREVFKSTPSSDRGLRDIVCRVSADNVKELVEKKQAEYLKEIGDIGCFWATVLGLVLEDREKGMGAQEILMLRNFHHAEYATAEATLERGRKAARISKGEKEANNFLRLN
ncbi:MAG: hypothetical protein M1840_007711 [Geoglossum simile]|nr:MAG: hypothetical protein M1840_007711 [Geoglossum simile]